MVGQSIICATVMVSSAGGPLHSWDPLLREGFFSLNHHWNHWMCHPNCKVRLGVINGDSVTFPILMF